MIPKSQIKIKYTNGSELETTSSKEAYIGYYIETNNGEYYMGVDNISLGESLQLIGENMNKNQKPTNNVKKYNLFKDGIKDFLEKTIPVPTMKKYPSEIDYQNGFFIRYFSKRINNSNYQEIDKDVYDSINKKESKYDYNLYEIGNLTWSLTENVYKKNTNELKKREIKFPNISYLFPLLNEFFKPDTLTLQENLTTEGGLYTADGEEYVGLYHIHPTGGPMVGAYHTDIPHPKLYYINQLPSPGGISYEEWLQSKETNNTPSSIPIRNKENTSNSLKSYNCIALWIQPEQDYVGLTNNQGLVPNGTSCVDPEDGTGTYNYNVYGEQALETCETNCSSINLQSTTNAGCMYSFDPNYCSDCNTHNNDACALEYYNFQSNNTCFCGNQGKQVYYASACCYLPDTDNSQDTSNPTTTSSNRGETFDGGGGGY